MPRAMNDEEPKLIGNFEVNAKRYYIIKCLHGTCTMSEHDWKWVQRSYRRKLEQFGKVA